MSQSRREDRTAPVGDGFRSKGWTKRLLGQTAEVKIRVTTCEMPDDPLEFVHAWDRLRDHLAAESSDLLVLNEAPFARWFARGDEFDDTVWSAAVSSHAEAIRQLRLSCGVIATAPIDRGDRRHNQAFSWTSGSGLAPWRRKGLLPDEFPVFEATWYHPGLDRPDVRRLVGADVGVLTCTEIWNLDWASTLGRLGAQIIATPRATGDDSLDNWHAAGRVAAIVSGAYSVSSNRVGGGFGGGGWIYAPDGELLASTDEQQPFVTVELDLDVADIAKVTYPRYALWSLD
jgi:N-carbamoylputrescine amidase